QAALTQLPQSIALDGLSLEVGVQRLRSSAQPPKLTGLPASLLLRFLLAQFLAQHELLPPLLGLSAALFDLLGIERPQAE
ncbi:hypothetical protein JTL50_35100, partial [Pseudomonas aeruginosa]|nr:hypothetical protein [Pseudomonas aeruginosa]